ncbi:MAG: retropepsin-like domain-containing protein [Elusimicrobia bacterium]|nr:retropepsin-like domain-containing protein [Candidatus Obscuribacterium magneticum]
MPRFKLYSNQPVLYCQAELRKGKRVAILTTALDTGATFTMVPNEAFLRIGINPINSKRRVRVTTGSSIVFARILTVPSFRALGHELKNFDVVCYDIPSESSIEGLIGLNFLRHFNVHLNFLDKNIELTPSRKTRPL